MVIALAPQAGFEDIGDLTSYKIPMAGSGVMVDKAYLAAHRDTVLRFLKADIEATALMQRDRRVFNAALAKWFNITDAKTQTACSPMYTGSRRSRIRRLTASSRYSRSTIHRR